MRWPICVCSTTLPTTSPANASSTSPRAGSAPKQWKPCAAGRVSALSGSTMSCSFCGGARQRRPEACRPAPPSLRRLGPAPKKRSTPSPNCWPGGLRSSAAASTPLSPNCWTSCWPPPATVLPCVTAAKRGRIALPTCRSCAVWPPSTRRACQRWPPTNARLACFWRRSVWSATATSSTNRLAPSPCSPFIRPKGSNTRWSSS